MRVTIIPEDDLVLVNGEATRLPLTTLKDQGIHAIQWYGTNGTVERKIGGASFLTSFSEYQSYVDQALAVPTEEPEPDPPATPKSLKEFAAVKRRRVEEGGILVNGLPISTDRTSQDMINKAVVLFDADPTLNEVDFALTSETFVTITKSQMRQIGISIGRHVQACFTKQRQLVALIDSGQITTNEQIDTWVGWNA